MPGGVGGAGASPAPTRFGGEQTTACKRGTAARLRPYHLGIARSPAYHYEPETNGCVEKFIQTLKEQVLWIERFDTHEQLRAAVRSFARRYNEHWLLERHGYRTPIEARQHLLAQPAMP